MNLGEWWKIADAYDAAVNAVADAALRRELAHAQPTVNRATPLPRLTATDVQRAIRLRDAGLTWPEIGEMTGRNIQALQDAAAKERNR